MDTWRTTPEPSVAAQPGAESPAALEMLRAFDQLDAYDADAAARLRQVHKLLVAASHQAADAVCALTRQDPAGHQLLDLLQRDGLHDGHSLMVRWLLPLIHPRLRRARHWQRARQWGEWLELIGCPRNLVSEAMWITLQAYNLALAREPLPSADRRRLRMVLAARMRVELQGLAAGSQEQALVRHQLILSLEHWLSTAADWPEFVRGAMQRLNGHLGIVAIALGRPDESAHIVFEFSTPSFKRYIAETVRLKVGALSMDERESFGHSPHAMAWRSRRIDTGFPTYCRQTTHIPVRLLDTHA